MVISSPLIEKQADKGSFKQVVMDMIKQGYTFIRIKKYDDPMILLFKKRYMLIIP